VALLPEHPYEVPNTRCIGSARSSAGSVVFRDNESSTRSRSTGFPRPSVTDICEVSPNPTISHRLHETLCEVREGGGFHVRHTDIEKMKFHGFVERWPGTRECSSHKDVALGPGHFNEFVVLHTYIYASTSDDTGRRTGVLHGSPWTPFRVSERANWNLAINNKGFR